MKKLAYLLSILLIAVIAFGISACQDDENQQQLSPDEFTVSYYDGNDLVEMRTVEKGGVIPELPMSKQGNRFVGWFLADGSGISGVAVESDISVYARWLQLYNALFNYGKDIPSKTVEAAAGESITLPESMKTDDGKEIILYWTDGVNVYEPSSVFVMPALNITLNAEWAEIVTVTYVYDGQEFTVETAKGATLKLADDVISVDGSPVYSWTDGSNVYRAGEEITVTQDMQLSAMWAGLYTLTYDVDGGELIDSETRYTGEEIILPLPVKTGYNFLGWQIGNDVAPSGAMLTVGADNITLKALWEKITFEVTITDWDGTPFEVLVVGYSDDVVFPEFPAATLAEFNGWSADGKNILQDTVITATYNYEVPQNAALYTFTQVEGGYAISAGDATLLNSTEIVLPASYRGLPVVAVADSSSSAFKAFSSLTKITLTSSYEKLGTKAFMSSPNLTTVVLNSNLKSIGNDCFMDCYKLTNLDLNEGLLSIGSRAFYNISVKDYYIPASVESIEGLAFFYYPVDQLNPDNCYKSITVAHENSVYASLDGVLYSKDLTKLVCYPANKDGTSFTLPSTVTTLGTYCFSYARNIEEFSFGDSKITTIERLAFNSTYFDILLPDSISEINGDMLSLAYGDLTLSNTIKVIPSYAFMSFYGKNVYIPATVETLEEYAFYHCQGVENVYFADGCRVEVIPAYAFEDCPKLTTVKLHEGLKEIGAFAFSVERVGSNQNKLASVTFPASLEKIGAYAFSYCAALTTVTFADGSLISEISIGAFGSCYKLKNVSFGNNNLRVDLVFGERAFALSDDLANFSFPTNLVSIGVECFAGSASQAYGYHYPRFTNIVLPARVREIGNGAFSLATSLVSFTTEEGSVLENVGSSVFYGCSKLTSVVLPASLRYMGSNVFAGCSELQNVEILSTTMNYEFVDGGLYNTDAKTLEFAKVDEDGVFTIKEGTVAIVDSCFAKSYELKVVNIASTVKTIGDRAFYDCANLEEVNIPQNSQLETIGEYAFAASPLESASVVPFTEIYLPPTLKSIGSNAFYKTAISNPIYLPAELTTLSGYAFAYCPNLPSVTFAENSKLTTIGAMAFYKCTSLTTVTFGEGSSLQSLGSTVFNGCSSLKTVVLTSRTVVSLGTNTFGNVPDDVSIYVPDNLLTSYINGTGWTKYTSYLKPLSQYN